MRTLIRNMLAVAVLLFGATSASAWTFTQQVRTNPTQTGGVQTVSSLTSTDTVIVDVFFTSDPAPSGLQNFTVGVLYDQGGLTYDAAASTNLPVVFPAPAAAYGTTGNQPGYIMYGAGKPATVLYPTQTPFQNWGAENLPGKLQVNIPFTDLALNQSTTAAANVWIASLVFHVEKGYLAGGAIGTIDLVMNLAQGGQLFANNDSSLGSTVNLGGPITLTVPEPALASLVLAGLTTVGLLYLRRRKSRIG